MAREVARRLDKRVELSLEGAEIELDRSILDRLSDPLVHLVRNAVGHGIELPSVRVEAGKSEVGQVVIDARRVKDSIRISIRDDGAIFVNLGIQRAEDEGSRVTIYSLEDQAGKIIRSRPDVPVYVKADHSLDYGEVIKVMTVLQRSGAESVGLVTDPPDLVEGA